MDGCSADSSGSVTVRTRKEILQYYQTLGLSPGASVDEIKRSYRMLLQRWHPDLFKPRSLMQTTAEDITKEINEAYENLIKKKLHRQWQSGPTPQRAAWEPPRSAPMREASQAYAKAAGPEPERAEPPPRRPAPETKRAAPRRPRPAPKPPAPAAAKPPRPVPAPVPRRSGYRRCALAVAVGGLAMVSVATHRGHWFFSVAGKDERTVVASRAAESTPVAPPGAGAAPVSAEAESTKAGRMQQPVGTNPAEADELRFENPAMPVAIDRAPSNVPELSRSVMWPGAAGPSRAGTPEVEAHGAVFGRLIERTDAGLATFEPGDSKARVIAVQGPPDDAGENIFRYGSSAVYFEHGFVTGWVDRRPALQVRAATRLAFGLSETFTRGSTRAEVIHAQGLPTAITHRSYFYGSSVVYFDGDWVTGWLELDQRLRVRSRAPPMFSDEAKADLRGLAEVRLAASGDEPR